MRMIYPAAKVQTNHAAVTKALSCASARDRDVTFGGAASSPVLGRDGGLWRMVWRHAARVLRTPSRQGDVTRMRQGRRRMGEPLPPCATAMVRLALPRLHLTGKRSW